MRADRFRIRKTTAENAALTLSNGRIVEIVDGGGLPTGAVYIHDGTTAGGVAVAGGSGGGSGGQYVVGHAALPDPDDPTQPATGVRYTDATHTNIYAVGFWSVTAEAWVTQTGNDIDV